MKHNMKVTLMLIGLFFISQIIGLTIISRYIDYTALREGRLEFEPGPGGVERPEVSGLQLVVMITVAILLGTGLLLLIIKFKRIGLWKIWYSIAVIGTLYFAFGGFTSAVAALIISCLLAYFKIFRPNIFIHNFTEVLIYGGLAAIFVPIKAFTIPYAFAILIIISIYDIYAVWHSKHMVTLANFTTQSKVFAGLSVPYNISSGKISNVPASDLKATKKTKVRNAILGGGDIGFPLIFAGVVFKTLVMSNTFLVGFLKALIIPVFATVALYILFIKGEKNKFYPAMPFLTAGCLAGYGVLYLVTMFI